MWHVWRRNACRVLVGKAERDQFEDTAIYARIVES
jgi:hypothetical protein